MAAPITSSTPIQSWRGWTPPGLEPAEVEQVVHQARQPRALGGDHGGELAPLLLGQRLRAQPARGGGDRGQRRAEVVRDRPQERRLHHVRAPQCLRLDHLRLELLAPPHGGHERLQARNHAVLERVEHLAARCSRGTSTVPMRPPVDDQRQRAPALVAVRPSELDRHRGRSKVLAMRWLAVAERVLDARRRPAARAPARRRDRPRAGGARPPPRGCARRPARLLVTTAATRKTTERHPVLALGDREPARRRDVEEVEREGAQRRRWPTPATAPSSSTRAAPRAGRRRRWRAPARLPEPEDDRR